MLAAGRLIAFSERRHRSGNFVKSPSRLHLGRPSVSRWYPIVYEMLTYLSLADPKRMLRSGLCSFALKFGVKLLPLAQRWP